MSRIIHSLGNDPGEKNVGDGVLVTEKRLRKNGTAYKNLVLKVKLLDVYRWTFNSYPFCDYRLSEIGHPL